MYRGNFNQAMMPRGGNRGMEGGNCGGNMGMRNNGNGRNQEKNNAMGRENRCPADVRNNAARQEEDCCCERNNMPVREENCCCERNNMPVREENCCCERNNMPVREENCCCERNNFPVREENCCCENTTQNAPQNADRVCECSPSVHDQLAGMALVMAYIPWQDYKDVDCEADGWKNGTIFQQLDFDFMARRCN